MLILIGLVSGGFFSRLSAAEEAEGQSPTLPRFEEVFEVLRENLSGTTDQKLNEAAVRGLIGQLEPKAELVDAGQTQTNGSALTSVAIFEKDFGYFRVEAVREGLAKELSEAFRDLVSTNRLKGLVIDLRFAGGLAYGEAAKAADWFLESEKPLIDWGEGMEKSEKKTNAITIPVAVLVNRKTTGAAEALAGILRYNNVGLLLGTNTAGQARVMEEFVLKSGHRLRVATGPIHVADNKALPDSGIPADIQVEVRPEDEREYYKDAYRILPRMNRLARLDGETEGETHLSVTNRPPRRRINEAELVRMMREGFDATAEETTQNGEGLTEPVVQDPVLARAIDLLKGLSVVRRFRSN